MKFGIDFQSESLPKKYSRETLLNEALTSYEISLLGI